MDRANRQQEEQPDLALSLIGIQPGMTVADIGAGSGYMTVRLARLVGSTGKVYANDVQPALLHIVQQKALAEHLSNTMPVQGTPTDVALPDNAIDVALLVDVYHEFSYPQQMLRSLRRCLKPGGRLVLIEYRKEDPTIPIADTHRMSVADVRTEYKRKVSRSTGSMNIYHASTSSYSAIREGRGTHRSPPLLRTVFSNPRLHDALAATLLDATTGIRWSCPTRYRTTHARAHNTPRSCRCC